MTYLKWFSLGGILFLLLIPVAWYGIGQYIYINWIQATMISGIAIGSLMMYIEITSDPIQKEGEKKDE